MQRNQNLIYIIKQETKLSRDGMGRVEAAVQSGCMHGPLGKPVHGCIVFLTPRWRPGGGLFLVIPVSSVPSYKEIGRKATPAGMHYSSSFGELASSRARGVLPAAGACTHARRRRAASVSIHLFAADSDGGDLLC